MKHYIRKTEDNITKPKALTKLKPYKKVGFTLAEVLITLTIVGVIAALTIPNLISKIQDHGFKSAFLKTYGVIREAAFLAEQDDAPFWTKSDIFMNPYYWLTNPDAMKNYFKIARGPFVRYNGGGQFAINQVYGNNFNVSTDVKLLNGNPNGTYYLVANGSAFAFQLEDSTIVVFFTSYGYVHAIYVDVNGQKKPNQWGRDIYFLQGAGQNPYRSSPYKKYTVLPIGAKGATDVWGTSTDTCKKGTSGMSCGYEILKDRSFNPPYQ